MKNKHSSLSSRLPGRLAQLVQSTSFTPRGSGVRVPHRPPRTKRKGPCISGAFCCPNTNHACLWAGHRLIWGHPSMLPGASRRTSPTTNKLPPTQITSCCTASGQGALQCVHWSIHASPCNAGLTFDTRSVDMARGMSAAHHQYVAASGSKAMTSDESLSATAPQTTCRCPPRRRTRERSSSTVFETPSRLWAPSSTTTGPSEELKTLPAASLPSQGGVIRQPLQQRFIRTWPPLCFKT